MDIIEKLNSSENPLEIIHSLSANKLEEIIKICSDSYHNKAISLVPDEIYDNMVEYLRDIKPNSSVLTKIGAPVTGKKVKLPYHMGSMDKLKTEEKIENWISEYQGPYVVSDKLDGISCLFTMVNHRPKLYTRGDGTYGQDITHLIDLINFPYNISENIDIATRGELVMSKNNFKKYEKIMANARNMVGGITVSKRDSIKKSHAKDVDFVMYEIIEPVMQPLEQMKTLKKWKMLTVFYDLYKNISLEILDNILKRRKQKSEYEIDGIIITNNKLHPRNVSGNPEYSFAYKGASQAIEVKVLNVNWKPSKDGVLIPVVHFQPVKLSGAILQYATGFNAAFIVDNKIGPGAKILVVRSGDVIPYIKKVIKGTKAAIPTNESYKWDKNRVNIILTDPNSSQIVKVQRLTKFMHEIGVDYLSEGIVKKIVEAGYDTIPKVIKMTKDDFLDLEGFKDTLATKLYNNLQNSIHNLDILTLMVASNLCGRGFGFKKLKKILDIYPNIVDEYNTKKRKLWEQKLIDIDGFAETSVRDFLDALPEFQELYDEISQIIDIKPYKPIHKAYGAFAGQVIVFTGFRNTEWEAIVEREGGRIASSVSKNTTLLVYADGDTSSQKYKKAISLGIDIMSKSEFSAKISGLT